ncbi:PREDICTED: uncharacterized protein LOC106815274 [Priapulus caudatus]|uniref:Uncharacterized protein LOC106815274 n=1 Tax=Priapulus caudatus TaxID=37621 RepID=A0ABM1ESN6_PRICU|nr:PREDICTED: uncharacterized protein LOC106815274 [Priapulus caudatus]
MRETTPTLAVPCNRDTCKLPDCRCVGADIPGNISSAQVPQMVLITFDDAVTMRAYDIYKKLVGERRNPNGCPIAFTFYVSHKYTEYSAVQNLYAMGHEIASHSITHRTPSHWWKRVGTKQWNMEIGGERDIIANLSGAPTRDVSGMRAPFLSVAGDAQFSALWDAGFVYDSSISTMRTAPPIWPYTLDHALDRRTCTAGCPARSYPGLWEVPMVTFAGRDGYPCAMVDGCPAAGSRERTLAALRKNFRAHYDSNRAPLPLFFHVGWFWSRANRLGFQDFVDEILALPDVWLVPTRQAIEWIRRPLTGKVLLGDDSPFACDRLPKMAMCERPHHCRYTAASGEVIVMQTCAACPRDYPWVRQPA